MDLFALSRHLLEAGIGIFIQSTCLIVLGLLAALLLRRRGPFFELAAHRATLVCVAASALMSIAMAGHVEPLWQVSLGAYPPQASLPIPAVDPAMAPRVTPFVSTTASAPREMLGVERESGAAALRRRIAFLWRSPAMYVAIIAIYLIVAGAQLLWLVVCGGLLRRFYRREALVLDGPIAEMIAEIANRAGVTAPRVMVHSGVESPFLAGVCTPTVFLPVDALDRYGEAGTRAVLAHELSHFLQRDCAWNLGFRLMAALFWPQALLQIVYRRWRESAEYACDQWVLAHACPPRSYAACLLNIAQSLHATPSQRALAIGVAPFRSMVGKRLARIARWRGGKLVMLSRAGRLAVVCTAVAAASGVLFLVSANAGAHLAPPSAHPKIAVSTHIARREALSQGEHHMSKKHTALTALLALAGGAVHVSLPAAAAPAASSTPVKSVSVPHTVSAARSAASKPAAPAVVAAAPVSTWTAATPKPTNIKVTWAPAAPSTLADANASDSLANRLIDLDVNEMPTKMALRALFTRFGCSFIVDSDVTGTITAHLDHVPLDVALKSILRANSQPLTYELTDNVYHIRTKHADVSSESLNGGGLGEAAHSSSASNRWYKVVLQNGTCTDVVQKINSLDPNSPEAGVAKLMARIEPLKADNSLLVLGTPEAFTAFRALLKTLDTAPSAAPKAQTSTAASTGSVS